LPHATVLSLTRARQRQVWQAFEGCLSHGPGDATKAAYNRGQMIARRRVVMQAWADFLDGKHAANVIPLPKRA
jgi:hypothetical protein